MRRAQERVASARVRAHPVSSLQHGFPPPPRAYGPQLPRAYDERPYHVREAYASGYGGYEHGGGYEGFGGGYGGGHGGGQRWADPAHGSAAGDTLHAALRERARRNAEMRAAGLAFPPFLHHYTHAGAPHALRYVGQAAPPSLARPAPAETDTAPHAHARTRTAAPRERRLCAPHVAVDGGAQLIECGAFDV